MLSYSISLTHLKIAAQLLSKTNVRDEDECWLFEGCVDKLGYGSINAGGRTVGAHRVSHEVFKGPVGDAHVLHSCDVPSCVNPKHLRLGSHEENMAECAKRERNRTPRPGNGHLKIDADASREIARLADAGMNYSQIGRQFSISAPTARYHHRKHSNAQ